MWAVGRGGNEGGLGGPEEDEAWALREVWQADGKGAYGMLPFVASRLRKTKGGTPTGDCPGASAVKGLLDKIDEDPNWFPGKRDGEKPGRKRVLRGPKKSAVVSAAKRIKAEGGEPTYSAVVAACPKALTNPDTRRLCSRCFGRAVTTRTPTDLGLTAPASRALPWTKTRRRIGWRCRSTCCTCATRASGTSTPWCGAP